MTKTKSTVTHKPPFVVTTEDVMDGSCNPQNPEKKFTMRILCNETNTAAFVLVPKHGKPVYALALVNRVTSTELFAETIEQISSEEAVHLSHAMDVEMTLADALVKMHNDQDGTEVQKKPWTPVMTPLNGKNAGSSDESLLPKTTVLL